MNHSDDAWQAWEDGWRRGFAETEAEGDDRRFMAPASTPAESKTGPGVFTGRDDSGGIEVLVDRTGAVADVVVPPTWRDMVSPHGLGQALFTAANNALNDQLVDAIEYMDLTSPVPSETGGQVADQTVRDLVLSEMVELLARVDKDLEDYRTRLETAVNVTATAMGPNRRVKVVLAPGRVTEVVVDPRWAARARYTEIRAEALGAFHAATRELGNPDPNSIPEPASIARLRELSRELLGTSAAEHSRRPESPHETKERI